MTTSQQKAFLDTIAYSELGHALIVGSDDGYNVLVGSTPNRINIFHSYADHPRELVHITSSLASTAAGRYQILEHIYDVYKVQLGLPDFSPASQDRIALQMCKECHALNDIEDGEIKDALVEVKSRWASLPGADYGQHENKMDDLVNAYKQDGGKVADDVA